MLTYANCKLKTEFPKPGIEQLTCLMIETLLFTEPPSPSNFVGKERITNINIEKKKRQHFSLVLRALFIIECLAIVSFQFEESRSHFIYPLSNIIHIINMLLLSSYGLLQNMANMGTEKKDSIGLTGLLLQRHKKYHGKQLGRGTTERIYLDYEQRRKIVTIST